MSTQDNLNDDARIKAIKPDKEKLVPSQLARQARRKAAEQKQRITIRVDSDILEEFKDLAGEEGSYQSLINLALRQWLEAQGLKELLRKDLPELVQQAIRSPAHS